MANKTKIAKHNTERASPRFLPRTNTGLKFIDFVQCLTYLTKVLVSIFFERFESFSFKKMIF